MIDIDLTLESFRDDNIERKKIRSNPNDNRLIVRPGEQCTLNIGLRRTNHSKSLKAYCPMFLKGKDESWFLILGDIENGELWALKRVSAVNNQQRYHQLQFGAPNSSGEP